jgi:DNA-binding CsgD family transcriptional regulator
VSPPDGISGARVERIWQALLARRGHERALLDLVDAIHVPVLLIRNDHRPRGANAASRLFLRRTAREVRSLTVHDLVASRQHGRLAAQRAKLLREGEVAGSVSLRPPDGVEVPVDYRGAANVLPGVHLFAWLPSRWTDDELDNGFEEPAPSPAARLTGRERDVLALLATGATLEQIAERRNVAVSTVRTQLRNAMRRLRAQHRTHAVAIALRDGEITLPP